MQWYSTGTNWTSDKKLIIFDSLASKVESPFLAGQRVNNNNNNKNNNLKSGNKNNNEVLIKTPGESKSPNPKQVTDIKNSPAQIKKKPIIKIKNIAKKVSGNKK